MAEVRVMQTNRGRVKVVYNDYQYTKHKNNLNGTVTWRCCARPCLARLRTRLGPDYRNPVVLGQHNHLGDPIMADVLQSRHGMKERVQQLPESVSSVVYREQLLQAPLEVAALIPSKETVGRALRYQRSKLRPPLPATAADLQLAPYQTVTHANDRFLLVDVVHENDRMLLFVSDFFLSLLCEAPLVFADGTFRMVPRIFTINFKYHSKLLPAVYALVRRKTESVYERILQECVRRRLQIAAFNFSRLSS